MTRFVNSFEEVRTPFAASIGGIVYATMTTVDRRGRPRARVLIPVWEVVDDRPVGWLATHRTPVEAAHLAGNPHATSSYWTPRQDFVAVDTVARWVDDEVTRRHVWEMYRTTSPPGAGYDLGRFWRDPDDPTLHVLRLEPCRTQVVDGRDLRATVWRPTTTADTGPLSGRTTVVSPPAPVTHRCTGVEAASPPTGLAGERPEVGTCRTATEVLAGESCGEPVGSGPSDTRASA